MQIRRSVKESGTSEKNHSRQRWCLFFCWRRWMQKQNKNATPKSWNMRKISWNDFFFFCLFISPLFLYLFPHFLLVLVICSRFHPLAFFYSQPIKNSIGLAFFAVDHTLENRAKSKSNDHVRFCLVAFLSLWTIIYESVMHVHEPLHCFVVVEWMTMHGDDSVFSCCCLPFLSFSLASRD